METESAIRRKTHVIFKTADTDNDGSISFDEYFAYMAKGKSVVQEAKAGMLKEFKLIDTDGSGSLSFEELVRYQIILQREAHERKSSPSKSPTKKSLKLVIATPTKLPAKQVSPTKSVAAVAVK